MTAGQRAAWVALAAGSKSFALAGRLLPRSCRDDAAVLYAWCRRCDDAVDLAGPELRAEALRRMRRELEAAYAGHETFDPVLRAFGEVVRRRRIPRRYPSQLLDGFQMDVEGATYPSLGALLGYAYCVAGTVGVMMAHVMGVTQPGPLRRAAHLGIAMQLTNICRDVDEDWRNGRLYLPRELLAAQEGARFDPTAARRAVRGLLGEADRFYASADAGLGALRFRCAVAIRAARLIYADIGRVIAARGHDVRRRAVVSRGRKLWLAARALMIEVTLRVRRAPRPPVAAGADGLLEVEA